MGKAVSNSLKLARGTAAAGTTVFGVCKTAKPVPVSRVVSNHETRAGERADCPACGSSDPAAHSQGSPVQGPAPERVDSLRARAGQGDAPTQSEPVRRWCNCNGGQRRETSGHAPPRNGETKAQPSECCVRTQGSPRADWAAQENSNAAAWRWASSIRPESRGGGGTPGEMRTMGPLRETVSFRGPAWLNRTPHTT